MIRAVLIFCSFTGLSQMGSGQVDAQLQTVYSHFVGVWVGTNCDYTKTPMLSTPVRIGIRDNPKKRELRLEYTYGTKGQKGYDHLVRFMAIRPAQSTVELAWQHQPRESYHVSGLKDLLSTGYGSFTCGGVHDIDRKAVLLHCVFHIEADSLTYSWEKSDDGIRFSKMGDWTLTRQSVGVGSATQP